MQLFMPFYFWTLHLIRRLIYSKQRQNLQDCNKPGAHSWHKRSHWHTVRSLSTTRATAACWVTPGQCHQLQRWATPGTHHPFPLGSGQEVCSTPPSCSKKPSIPSQWQVSHHREAILGNSGIIHPVAEAPVCCLVMREVPAKGTFHGLFNVSW